MSCQLDLGKIAHPVLGDEQILDVELDRNTELSPVNLAYTPRSWEASVPPGENRHDDKLSVSINSSGPSTFYTSSLILS